MSPIYSLDELHRLRESSLTVQPSINLRKTIDGWIPKPVLLPTPQTALTPPRPKPLDPTTPPYQPSASRVEKFDTSALREKYPSALTDLPPKFPHWNFRLNSKENTLLAKQAKASTPSDTTPQPQSDIPTGSISSKSKKDPNILISLEDSESDSDSSNVPEGTISMFSSVLAQLNFPQAEPSSITYPHFERDSEGKPLYFQHLCFQQKFLKLSPEEIQLKERFPWALIESRANSRPTQSTASSSTWDVQQIESQTENLLEKQDEQAFESKALQPTPIKRAHSSVEVPSLSEITATDMPSKKKKGKNPKPLTEENSAPSLESRNTFGQQQTSTQQQATNYRIPQPHTKGNPVGSLESGITFGKQYASPKQQATRYQSRPGPNIGASRPVSANSLIQAPLNATAFQTAMRDKGLDLGSSKHATSMKDAADQIPEPTFTKRDDSQASLARSNVIFDKTHRFSPEQAFRKKQGKMPPSTLPPKPSPILSKAIQGPPVSRPVPSGPAKMQKAKAGSSALSALSSGIPRGPRGGGGPKSNPLKFDFSVEIPNFRKENSDFHQSAVRMVAAPNDALAEENEPDGGDEDRPTTPVGQTVDPSLAMSPAQSSCDGIVSSFRRLRISPILKRADPTPQKDHTPIQPAANESSRISEATTEIGAIENRMLNQVTSAARSLQISGPAASLGIPNEPTQSPGMTANEDLTVAGQEANPAHEEIPTLDYGTLYRYAFRVEEGRWPQNDNEVIEWTKMFQSSVPLQDHGVSFEDIEAISFCLCSSAIQERKEALELDDVPPLYPFFFRLVKGQWPSVDAELIAFSAEVRTQMTPEEGELEGANINDLEGFESFAFCDCETGKEVRVQMQKGSMFGADSDGMPSHNCNKFDSAPATASGNPLRFSKFFGKMSASAGHYTKEHRRVWFTNNKK